MNNYVVFGGAVVLAVLCILPTPSEGLKCWECNSLTESKCVDPFTGGDPSFTLKQTDCSSNQVCWKFAGKTSGVQGINRGCTQSLGITDECKTTKEGDNEVANCYCSTDLCNGGEKTTFMSVLGLLTAGLVGVNYFRL